MSKPSVSAAMSSSPLEILSHPRSIASVTSWPESTPAMPLGVPWSKRMRISRTCCADRNPRRVEAASGKFEHSLNLLPGHMKLLDDLLYARTRLKILKNRGNGHPGTAEHPFPATSVRHAFDGGTLGPIESWHLFTLLPP